MNELDSLRQEAETLKNAIRVGVCVVVLSVSMSVMSN